MNVQLPDNSVVQFPDGMPEDQVNNAVQNYLQPANPSTNLQRIGYGASQPSQGIAQGILHAAQYLPDSLLNAVPGLKGSDSEIDSELESSEENYQKQRAAAGSTGFDWDKTIGNMGAASPLAAVMPAAEYGLLANAGVGAAEGAGFGAIQPVTHGDFYSQKKDQVGAGALNGGIVTPAVSAISSMISPNVSPQVQSLMDEGITPTPGQILGGGWKTTEDKLTSVPVLGDVIQSAQGRAMDDFNKAALGRALDPIGENPPSQIGREGLNYVSDKLGDAYDQVLPNLTFKSDPQFLADTAQARVQLPTAQQPKFDEIVGNQLSKLDANGEATGDTLKGIQSMLSKNARGYGADASYDARQLGEALDDVHSAFGDSLQRSNSQDATQLANINEGYANYAILRKAAANNKENGTFTPAQLAQAIRGNDQSVGKGAFARGYALMQDLSDSGVSVLGNKYPDSGTAGRAMAEMGGAALLGHAVIPPHVLIGAGATIAPYATRTTQKLAAALLVNRPDFFGPVSNAVRSSSPFLTSGAVAAGQ